MKGFQTVYVRGVGLFVRKEHEGSFLVFNPAENVGTIFSITELLVLADLIDGKNIGDYPGFNRFKKMLVAISIQL